MVKRDSPRFPKALLDERWHLTLDMRRGAKRAQRALRRRLDGRVRFHRRFKLRHDGSAARSDATSKDDAF